MKRHPGCGRRKAAAISCAVILSLVFAGPLACRRARSGDDGGFSVIEQIRPQPVRIGPAEIDIRVADASGKPLNGATVTVEADMSHPGMSPVFAKAREQNPGTYLATVNLTMGGDWVVLTHIKLPGGKRIERQMSVRGVRSH
jgi:hypothetical protein